MLDESLRLTFRNYATLFLVAATVTVPLHLGLAFATRDVVGISELHRALETFPETRRVRNVGRPDLDAARRARLIVTAIEIALLPLAVGATRRVVAAEAEGRLPGALDAWAHSAAALGRVPGGPRAGPLAVVVGIVLAAGGGYALHRMAIPFIELVPGTIRFGPLGLLEGVAGAFGAPFALVPLALVRLRAEDVEGSRSA